MIIRRFAPADLHAVWNLHKVALVHAESDAGDGPWDDDLRDIEVAYVKGGGEFLVGIHDGALVAMGALRVHGPNCAEVKRMRVHPQWQRRGFGRLILIALEDRAQALGFRVLRLDTSLKQEAAQRLYSSHGYTITSYGHVLGLPSVFYEKVLVGSAAAS